MIDLSSSEEEVALALLSLYDIVDSFDEFCEWLQIDPSEPASVALFDSTHEAYASAWKELGHEEFRRQLRKHRRYLYD